MNPGHFFEACSFRWSSSFHASLTVIACVQESRTYWFNAASLEADEEFMLIGLVLGLAIYNAVLLDFPLPQALYRKLLGQTCTLRDLSDMDPTLGRSLAQLLAYDGNACSKQDDIWECICFKVPDRSGYYMRKVDRRPSVPKLCFFLMTTNARCRLGK